MKMSLLPALVVAGFVAAGCAPEPLTRADVDGRVVCNADRMDEVDRAARRENKEVHWLRCPQAILRAM